MGSVRVVYLRRNPPLSIKVAIFLKQKKALLLVSGWHDFYYFAEAAKKRFTKRVYKKVLIIKRRILHSALLVKRLQ